MGRKKKKPGKRPTSAAEGASAETAELATSPEAVLSPPKPRKKYQNPSGGAVGQDQCRLNGVMMRRDAVPPEVANGAMMADRRVELVIASAKHCPIAEELAAWQSNFQKIAQRSKQVNLGVTADYLTFLTKIEKRLSSQRDQLQRRFSVLNAIQQMPGNRRQRLYEAQIAKVRERIEQLNQNIETWVCDNTALRESKWFGELDKWFHSKYVEIGGQTFRKSHLAADEKVEFEDALEEIKQMLEHNSETMASPAEAAQVGAAGCTLNNTNSTNTSSRGSFYPG